MKQLFTFTTAVALVTSITFAAARNIVVHQPGVPFVPGHSLPPSHAQSKCDQIVNLFQTLGRTTIWKLVDKVLFEGPWGEPEGIVRVGEDRYFVSEGEYTVPTVSFGGPIINGTDRTPGAGTGHIKVFDGKGSLIADARVSNIGSDEYHNGGIDYSDGYIWATIAQYRPNTTAHVIRINPKTLEYTTLFRADDHYGGAIYDPETGRLYALNWGSRNASIWDLKKGHFRPHRVATPIQIVRNPSYFIDYQDCKFLGHPAAFGRRAVALCGGVAMIGGVAIVDLETMVPLAEIPMILRSDLGVIITNNPIDVDIVDNRLRFFFMPDSGNGTLYVYEAQPQSPFEF